MWKEKKGRLLFLLAAIAVLAAAFWLGEPSAEGEKSPALRAEQQAETKAKPSEPKQAAAPAAQEGGTDAYQTEPVPAGKPKPVEPQAVKPEKEAKLLTCTVSISCQTVLEHREELEPSKAGCVPADGWILPPVTVSFQEGESAFDVLRRTCQERKIHMEFQNTPVYNSAYIEGINNLYEFDCGPLSGWMYQVNGWFPNYGCSRYQLRDGDQVCWVYSCDLGAGGNS